MTGAGAGAAVAAAVAVARRHGLAARAPVVLREAGAALIWLSPAPVVAKVAALDRGPGAAAVLLRELRVVQHLARSGAPIVAPSPELPGRVHLEDRFALTFWEHHDGARRGALDAAGAARALAEVHAALAGCPVDLPSFRERRLAPAGRTLASAGGAALVPAGALPLLRSVHAAVTEQLLRRAVLEVPVHGDPRAANAVAGSGGCLWTGFEAACRAPVEWDLAALPGGGAGVFAGVDGELLRVLRAARSLVAAIWCWRHLPPSPARDAAVRPHLALLRREAAALAP